MTDGTTSQPVRPVARIGKPADHGKLKNGDDWNAIRIIALSQCNPLKAISFEFGWADGVVGFWASKALVPDPAQILANANTPLVVVCDKEAIAVGVMSRTDIIKLLASAGTAACDTTAGAIMTKNIVSCHVEQPLQQVWTVLSARSLRCAPILAEVGRPQGVVHGLDLVRALLEEETHEEELLCNYVMGVGYQ